MKRIDVVAGVILRDQQVLIALRPTDKHKGGYWEFPGGKIEPGEEIELALKRELKEEINLEVTASESWLEISHDYPDKAVYLHFWKVTGFEGEAKGLEGQEVRWVSVADLANYQFPEANVPVMEALVKEFA